jgi:hypothetical protein
MVNLDPGPHYRIEYLRRNSEYLEETEKKSFFKSLKIDILFQQNRFETTPSKSPQPPFAKGGERGFRGIQAWAWP